MTRIFETVPHIPDRYILVTGKCVSYLASSPGFPTRQQWKVRRGRAWYPFTRDATEQMSQIYLSIAKFRCHSHADHSFSYSLFLRVANLSLSKWKEGPGYAVDGARQFASTNFRHWRESGTSKSHSVLILNCTGIPGCLYHQVTSFAVLITNIISLLIYHCHKNRHAVVVTLQISSL